MSSVRSPLEERHKANRKIFRSFLASILLHIFLILLITWLSTRFRSGNTLITQKKEIMPGITMDFMSASEPQYLETHSRQTMEKAPQKTYFESDKNTQAASQLLATGKVPLPTLDGKESESLQFENREYSAGKHSGGSIPSTASRARQAQKQQKEISKQIPPPVPRMELPILRPLQDLPHKEETQQASQAPSSPSLQHPALPAEQPGYQSETRMVKINGNISNRGQIAADVAATPLGRYKKLLSNAIGARWYYLVQRDLDMYRIGTVAIRFSVSQNGKVQAVKVVSNTSNELLAATSIQSITDAEMPPIPSDVAKSLHEGRIEVDYSFSIISN